MSEDILYSDFNGIRITGKRFYAGKKSYALNKIKKINLQRVIPNKQIGISLFSLGILTILLGSFEVFGSATFQAFESFWILDNDFVSIAFGVILLIIAILRMLISPDEYAVKVETKDGHVESIISNNRKYAARIAASLKRAYYRQSSKMEPKENLVTT